MLNVEQRCAINQGIYRSATSILNRKSIGCFFIFLLFAFTGSLLPIMAQAGGPVIGARQAGMGTAFVAVADDLSAIAINPAGLVQSKGTSVNTGVTVVILKTTYQSPAGNSEHTQAQTFYAPNLFIASDIGRSDLAMGVGVFSLYGIGGRKWDEAGMTRYISTESTIGTMVANPTVAWRPCPTVSIGLGVDYLYAQNHAERMVNQSAAGGADGKLSLDADGTGWGYNAGMMFTPVDGFQIGLAYRSAIRVDQKGTAELNTIAPALQLPFGGASFETGFETQLDFPERLTMGFALKADNRLMISTEVEWIRWSRFDRQDVDFDSEVPAAGFSDLSIDLKWEDIWLIKVGGEYEISGRFALRAGYAFVQSPVPEETLGPGSPDADSHNVSLGVGYRIGRVDLDVFYMAAFFTSIAVDNEILDGTYHTFAQYLGLGIGYRF